jgi:hypothetical protein
MSPWTYQNNTFTKEDAELKIAEGCIGFIYEITDVSNGKKYIGKKLLITKRKRPPLKGQKRKRIDIIQSDWAKYYGSSEKVKLLVDERPADFQREILEFCKAKGELSYIEAKWQFTKEVLLTDDYYNEFIGCKINASHLKNLWKK